MHLATRWRRKGQFSVRYLGRQHYGCHTMYRQRAVQCHKPDPAGPISWPRPPLLRQFTARRRGLQPSRFVVRSKQMRLCRGSYVVSAVHKPYPKPVAKRKGPVSRETGPQKCKILGFSLAGRNFLAFCPRGQNIHDSVEIFYAGKLDADASLSGTQRDFYIGI